MDGECTAASRPIPGECQRADGPLVRSVAVDVAFMSGVALPAPPPEAGGGAVSPRPQGFGGFGGFWGFWSVS